jgi:flagellar motility protein MotE (MotC chaperone)
MSSRVRLLPALIGAVGVLFALRIGAMASGAEQKDSSEPAAVSAPTDAAAATPSATPSDASASHPTEVAAAATPSPAVAAAPAATPAQSKGEAEVLQNLTQRRETLDARERDLGLREQLMSATEKRVSEHLVELKELQAKLDAMLAQRDAAEEAQLASLVKTYENMKASDAATIFNKLDRQVMLAVAQRMKPAKIGAVMAAMDPARAQDLTVMLATRMNLPRPQPVISAPPPPPAIPDASTQAAPLPPQG